MEFIIAYAYLIIIFIIFITINGSKHYFGNHTHSFIRINGYFNYDFKKFPIHLLAFIINIKYLYLSTP